MEWLNFRHLYAFWMVSRTLSFTRAAEAMRIAQSAVSEQVAQLEEYLGERLFIRSTRSLELTPAGVLLMGYAQPIFEKSRDINNFLKDKLAPIEVLNLRVGVVGGASRTFVYRMLEKYLDSNPSSHVSVTTGSYEELYEQLRRIGLDILISLELPRKKDLEEFTYQKIGESPMCLVGNKRLITQIRKAERKKPIDIFKFRHPYEVEIIDRFVAPLVKCQMNLKLNTDDVPLLRFFATSGKGLVIMPKVGVLEDLNAGTVEAIELKKCPEVIIYGIFMKHLAHQKSVDLFLS